MNSKSHICIRLDSGGQDYEVFAEGASGSLSQIAHDTRIELHNIARSQLLVDSKGAFLLAIFPASHCIDVPALGRQLQHTLTPATEAHIEQLFPSCNPQALPPLSTKETVPTIIDSVLASQAIVYFPSDHQDIIRMLGEDFNGMLDHAWHGFNFSYPLPGYDKSTLQQANNVLSEHIEQRLTKLDTLPTVPGTGRELLRLLNNSNGRVSDLARILEHDPAVSAQLLKQARSALYGLGQSIKTIDAAIVRIFGYDTALHVALGISTASNFKGPKHGQLGLQRIYRDAVLVSALCESLARHIPVSRRPAKGTAQLAGLLHNLGYLILAHLFTDDYAQLNAQLPPLMDNSIYNVVKDSFDSPPEQIAAWLMGIWDMPQSLIIAQREQRNLAYSGMYAVHAQLVLIANRLLHSYGFGDASTAELPEEILFQVGLNEDIAYACLEKIIDNSAELKYLAEQLVA